MCIITRSSAVAVIADRTAYDVSTVCSKTIKPVSITSLRTAGTQDPIDRLEFMNAPKAQTQSHTQSTQA